MENRRIKKCRIKIYRTTVVSPNHVNIYEKQNDRVVIYAREDSVGLFNV